MQAKASKQWLHDALLKGTFPREDYRELAELCYIWLGGESLPTGRTFAFRKPGAFHHARFMSKAIYLLKIALLSERIEINQNQRQSVQRMAFFIGVFYARYFLRSRIAAFAPVDDYKFYCQRSYSREEDEDISQAVLAVMARHFW